MIRNIMILSVDKKSFDILPAKVERIDLKQWQANRQKS